MRRRTSSTSRPGVSLVAQRGHPLEIGAHELRRLRKDLLAERRIRSHQRCVLLERCGRNTRHSGPRSNYANDNYLYPFRLDVKLPGAAAPEHVGHVKLWPAGVQRNEGHRDGRGIDRHVEAPRLWHRSDCGSVPLFHLTSAVGVQRVARHERLDLQQERQRQSGGSCGAPAASLA